MNQSILIALLTVFGTIAVATITGFVSYMVGSRKNDTDLATKIRDELRADRNEAREEAKDLRDQVEALTKKVEELEGLVKSKNAQAEAAEQKEKRASREAENARAEAEGWQARYEKEHELVNALSIMYETATKKRPPDAVLLAMAEETMRKAGFLPAAPKTDDKTDETKEEKL